MRRRALLLGILLAVVILPFGCGAPQEEISKEITDEIENLKKEKDALERKMREIDTARATLEKSTASAVDALETIRNALGEIRTSLEVIEKVPTTTPGKPRRLPLHVSLLLLAITVLCVLMALKLRSIRLRQIRGKPNEGNSSEPKDDPAKA